MGTRLFETSTDVTHDLLRRILHEIRTFRHIEAEGEQGIFRIPYWLRDAFGFTEGPLPSAINTGAIQAVVDVLQGGWGQRRVLTFAGTIPASAGAGTSTDITVGTDVLKTGDVPLLFGIRAVHNAGAAATNVRLEKSFQARIMGLARASVPNTGGVRTMSDFAAGQPYIVLPPQESGGQAGVLMAMVNEEATAVGETIDVTGWGVLAPYGAKPI